MRVLHDLHCGQALGGTRQSVRHDGLYQNRGTGDGTTRAAENRGRAALGAVSSAHPSQEFPPCRASHLPSSRCSALAPRAVAADPPPVVATSRASRSRPTPSGSSKALDFLGTPLPADAAKALDDGHRRQGREEDPGAARPARAVRREHQPGVAGEGRPRAGRRRRSSRPANAGARQGGQREHGEEAAADHQPAVRRPSTAAPAATNGTRRTTRRSSSGSSRSRCSPPPPMTDEPERAEGRVRHRPDLQQPRPASARRRIGFDVGQGNQDLGFRGEVPVLFDVQAGDPGEAERHRLRRQADRRPVHVHRRGRARLPAAGRSGSPRTSSSRSRSTGPTAAPCCCRRASSRWSTAAARSTSCSSR